MCSLSQPRNVPKHRNEKKTNKRKLVTMITVLMSQTVSLLVVNGTFITNRLYRDTGLLNIACRARGQHKYIIQSNNETIQ